MLQAKQKLCSGCNEITNIWKKEGKQRFCKSCWNSQNIKGLSSTKKPTAKKPLSPRSSKQEKLDALYSILRKKYLENHPMCEAKLPGCGLSSTDIHHKMGRTGNRYLDDTEFLSVCRVCHQWIELHPTEAKLLDFSKSRES